MRKLILQPVVLTLLLSLVIQPSAADLITYPMAPQPAGLGDQRPFSAQALANAGRCHFHPGNSTEPSLPTLAEAASLLAHPVRASHPAHVCGPAIALSVAAGVVILFGFFEAHLLFCHPGIGLSFPSLSLDHLVPFEMSTQAIDRILPAAGMLYAVLISGGLAFYWRMAPRLAARQHQTRLQRSLGAAKEAADRLYRDKTQASASALYVQLSHLLSLARPENAVDISLSLLRGTTMAYQRLCFQILERLAAENPDYGPVMKRVEAMHGELTLSKHFDAPPTLAAGHIGKHILAGRLVIEGGRFFRELTNSDGSIVEKIEVKTTDISGYLDHFSTLKQQSPSQALSDIVDFVRLNGPSHIRVFKQLVGDYFGSPHPEDPEPANELFEGLLYNPLSIFHEDSEFLMKMKPARLVLCPLGRGLDVAIDGRHLLVPLSEPAQEWMRQAEENPPTMRSHYWLVALQQTGWPELNQQLSDLIALHQILLRLGGNFQAAGARLNISRKTLREVVSGKAKRRRFWDKLHERLRQVGVADLHPNESFSSRQYWAGFPKQLQHDVPVFIDADAAIQWIHEHITQFPLVRGLDEQKSEPTIRFLLKALWYGNRLCEAAGQSISPWRLKGWDTEAAAANYAVTFRWNILRALRAAWNELKHSDRLIQEFQDETAYRYERFLSLDLNRQDGRGLPISPAYRSAVLHFAWVLYGSQEWEHFIVIRRAA